MSHQDDGRGSAGEGLPDRRTHTADRRRRYEPNIEPPPERRTFGSIFRNRIDAGHIMQAIVIAGSMGAAIWAFAIYSANQNAQILVMQQRMDQFDKTATEDRKAQHDFIVEVRNSLEKINTSIVDLRIRDAINSNPNNSPSTPHSSFKR